MGRFLNNSELTSSSTHSKPLLVKQETCSDITKPAKNPKLSAMIDAIVNNGEVSDASKKMFQPTTSRKLDYSKMIDPSSDAESTIIPSTPPKKKLPVKMISATKPRKIDYSKMIRPSSDEESEPEGRHRKKRRRYSSESDEG